MAAIRNKSVRDDRRIFLTVLAVFVLFAVAVFIGLHGAAYRAYWAYVPQEGDVVFQSLPRSRLVNAIEGVSDSPYSHCGIVARHNGAWVVYEAYHNVEITPLKDFLFRGREFGFAVYRLRPEYQSCIPEMIAAAKTYLGRSYDSRYRMDDEAIYCTELVYKAFQSASGGEQLGRLVRLGDLNWQPFSDTISFYEGGPVPLDRKMSTPRDMAQADQLEPVFVHRLQVYGKME